MKAKLRPINSSKGSKKALTQTNFYKKEIFSYQRTPKNSKPSLLDDFLSAE